jgi:DNA modification methylase
MILVQDADFTLHVGDVLEQLAVLPDESVHCVVTSPPFWGLRDYGTGRWEGGSDSDPCPDCTTREEQLRCKTCMGTGEIEHVHETVPARSGRGGSGAPGKQTAGAFPSELAVSECSCGATRVDQQLGLEATPELFVAAMVDVFREVRRVLRRDGTCWINLGDSYNSIRNDSPGDGFRTADASGQPKGYVKGRGRNLINGLKQKDLVGIPWRVAFALQADGWYLRSDIIWSKPNPMPESVTDRPTKAHEYVFLLTRSPRYFFDADAVREDGAGRLDLGRMKRPEARMGEGGRWANDNGYRTEAGRNIRSVWEIATQPYPEAHFATFPEALPERCIKAGTSERGCCPVCGAPWERVVMATGPDGRSAEVRNGKAYDEDGQPLMGDNMIDHGVRGSWNSGGKLLERETKGWRPTCACGEPAYTPCTVLDPFMGSGTTALVARRLGRRSIGVELSPDYARICAKRLQQLSLFAGATDG